MIAENEFLLALTTVRATYGPASINETDLKEIVATEESRVADAAVIAELIATGMTALQPQPAATPAAPLPLQDDATPSLPTPIPFPTRPSASPFSITELIDGMLAQEKRDVRIPS
jgi:hypothetical protein